MDYHYRLSIHSWVWVVAFVSGLILMYKITFPDGRTFCLGFHHVGYPRMAGGKPTKYCYITKAELRHYTQPSIKDPWTIVQVWVGTGCCRWEDRGAFKKRTGCRKALTSLFRRHPSFTRVERTLIWQAYEGSLISA